MHSTDSHDPDRRYLRRYLRDFAALTALPAVWSSAGRQQIGENLADVLVRILLPDFIYVRLKGLTGQETIEVARCGQEPDLPERQWAIRAALEPLLPGDASATAVFSLPHPLGDGLVDATATPIGAGCKFGVLVAASGQPNFPSEEDRLLLGVAANQAAIVLQRQRAEEALRQQSEWLRVTLGSIGDAVITTDTTGRVTSLNAVAESLTGWPQAEANGQPLESVFRIVNEQSRGSVENPATRVLREGRIIGLANHTVLIARDGTERAIDDSAAPIKDEQGNLLGVVLIFRDVSEKRQSERAVAESEARKAAILLTALDCIITCDEQGRVLEFNPAAQRTFGYGPAEVIGGDLADLIIPASLRERHKSGMARYLASGEEKLLNRRIEMTARRADGTEFPAELAITRIPTPGPVQFTAYLRDISERIWTEARRNARLLVTQVLAQATTVKEAAPRILQAVCEGLGWDMGAFWTVDRQANVLRCQELWHTASVRAEAFVGCCRQGTFDPGIGLPGRVWQSGRPAWIPDVAQDTNFPRAASAVKEGLHGAFGAPVLSGSELLGVIEFFSREIREPDSDLLEMMTTIGSQIGQFMDRKAAEEALRRLAAIVESSDDAIISKNLNGIIVSWNKGAERLYGYTALEIVGKPLAILVPPDHSDELPAIMGRLKRGERIEHYETVRVAKDGRRLDVALTISPVRDAQGKIVGASKIARDISERKRAETLLACQKHALEMVAEGSPLAQILDLLVQTTEAESTAGMLAAIHLLDRTGKHFQQAIAPSLPETYHRATAIAIDSDRGPCCRAVSSQQAVVIPDIAADSQWSAFAAFATSLGFRSCWSTPIRSSEGKVLGTFANYYRQPSEPSSQDRQLVEIVTRTAAVAIERVQAREALQQSEQTARFLAEASATLADLTDYESTLQRIADLAVPKFADWCAVDVQEADGSVRRLAVTHTNPVRVRLAHELFQRYPPQPTDAYGVMAVLRSGEPEWSAAIPESPLMGLAVDENRLQIIRDLGLKSYICVPLRTRAKILGVLTFVTAESGRVYDEADVRAAEDLAARAAIAIENASLLAALKATDRRKDEFLAMLAHELRNPLAPIRNAVQIFRAKGSPVPELQWARDVIDRQVQQMTRLVDDLLDVSRITRGKIELRKERVELATVVESAVEDSRPLIEKWDHELTVKLPSEPVYLDADPTRLAQVLLNLLNNAVKYTEQGGRIGLTAEKEGQQVALRIKDTGIGIPQEMLPRIFEMFTQVDRSLERSQGGLGIGLTLVQSLVEMQGGTVEAHSDGPGKGSEFVVRLPVAAEVRDRGTQGTADNGEPVAAPAKHRILVVDDNRDAADSLAMLLRILGNEVHIAHDGLEAVGAAGVFRPDVVLLDIGLPKLNGYEAGRRIREQQGNGVVLIALTGWGQEEDRRRSKEAGFDYHMTKPVEFNALQKVLADLKAAH